MAAGHVKLALVGYGRFAPRHVDALRASGATIVAACNRSDAGRARAQAEGKIPATYARIADMLERERPDGIVVTASVDAVGTVARELLPSGLPLLLEKPPGTSLAEYEALVTLAEQHATPVMVGLNRRHYSVVQAAIADMGGLARVTGVFVDWTEDPTHLLRTGHTEAQVGAMIFGNSIHGIDLMTYLGGELARPQVSAWSLGDPFRWMMAAQGHTTRGALASFRSTWDAPGRWRVEVTSPGRRYVFQPLETCRVTEAGVKEERMLEPAPRDLEHKAGMRAQAEHFMAMVASRVAPPIASLAAARPAMAVCEALAQAVRGSTRETQRIRIPPNI